jgi:16S rRNA processing protein RimM
MIKLGVITGAHGIRGEVKLRSFTADPKAIAIYGPLHTASGTAIEILRLRPQGDSFIAVLKGITGRNQAEALRGTELFIARERLDANETYLADLIGMTVLADGKPLGIITRFENYGAGDLMDVGGTLIPAAFIVSAGGGMVVVELPEGFLEFQ